MADYIVASSSSIISVVGLLACLGMVDANGRLKKRTNIGPLELKLPTRSKGGYAKTNSSHLLQFISVRGEVV